LSREFRLPLSEADGFNTMLKAPTRPLDTGELFQADELIGQ
jgi:hypothetical protein